MSFLTTIISGLSKAENFLINVFTKGSAVLAVLSKVSPTTLAAILAVFYDVAKAAVAAGEEAAAIASGNFVTAATLSATTLALVGQLVTDLKTADSQIVDDFNQLGIAINTPTTTTNA